MPKEVLAHVPVKHGEHTCTLTDPLSGARISLSLSGMYLRILKAAPGFEPKKLSWTLRQGVGEAWAMARAES
eukprot:6146829-Alexandrium_andersonii.AAC.1